MIQYTICSRRVITPQKMTHKFELTECEKRNIEKAMIEFNLHHPDSRLDENWDEVEGAEVVGNFICYYTQEMPPADWDGVEEHLPNYCRPRIKPTKSLFRDKSNRKPPLKDMTESDVISWVVRQLDCNICTRAALYLEHCRELEYCCFACKYIYDVYNEYLPPKYGFFPATEIELMDECGICVIKRNVIRNTDIWCQNCDEYLHPQRGESGEASSA